MFTQRGGGEKAKERAHKAAYTCLLFLNLFSKTVISAAGRKRDRSEAGNGLYLIETDGEILP